MTEAGKDGIGRRGSDRTGLGLAEIKGDKAGQVTGQKTGERQTRDRG